MKSYCSSIEVRGQQNLLLATCTSIVLVSSQVDTGIRVSCADEVCPGLSSSRCFNDPLGSFPGFCESASPQDEQRLNTAGHLVPAAQMLIVLALMFLKRLAVKRRGKSVSISAAAVSN